MNRPAALVACALLPLAACAEEPEAEAEATAAPIGEVLDPAVSDEMIPYDLLRSQPPRAAPVPGEGGADPGPAAGEAAAPAAAAQAGQGDAPTDDSAVEEFANMSAAQAADYALKNGCLVTSP